MEVEKKETIVVYHNNMCSRSRCALEFLNDKKIEYTIVPYLNDTPNRDELKNLIQKLGIKPEELIRKGEKIYLEKFQNKVLSNAQWIAAMVKYPILIERPIVVKGQKAVIARPAERILDILS